MSSLFLFALLFLLYCTIGTLAVTEHHRCMFDLVSKHVGVFADDSSNEMTKLSSRGNSASSQTARNRAPSNRETPGEGWEPIRIELVTDGLGNTQYNCVAGVDEITMFLKTQKAKCTEKNILTEEKKKILVDEILPEAIKLHSERLFVQRMKDPIHVPSFNSDSLCFKFPIPNNHKTVGVPNADMVLYVAAAPTPDGTFAWAATCATLGRDGRPVVGIINYGPRYIVATPQHVRVAAHEIAHALGFNVELMERKNIVRSGVTLRKKTNVALVISDNTRREVMKHYKCETAQGMELQSVIARRKTKEDRGTDHVKNRPQIGHDRRHERQIIGAHTSLHREGQALLAQVASVKDEYQLRELHNNAIDGRFNRMESPDSAVQERSGEEGSNSVKGTHITPLSSDVLLKRRSLNLRTALMTSGETCNSGKEVKTQGDKTECIVETLRFPPNTLGPMPRSHWSRRIAKDELMVGLVGAGYYTALTMGAFADLKYYKVNWTMAEEMSWGNKAGCELLNDTCVKSGSTKFLDMFCTTESGELPAGLQCTSDRQSLGSCSLKTTTDEIPVVYRYFSENNKLGSEESEHMDYCPFIAALPERSCLNGVVDNNMPGSRIGGNSRCVLGKNLLVGTATVGAVCVDVSCKFGKVSVRYSGDDKWYNCPEDKTLTMLGESLKGEIMCPKYADVCNTINKSLDEAQGPKTDPGITPEVEATTTTAVSPENPQPTTEATNTQSTTETTNALSTNEGAAPSDPNANNNVVEPVVQNKATQVKETVTDITKVTGSTSPVKVQKTNITTNKTADGSFAASAFVCVMFVLFSVSVIMVP